MHGMFRGQMAVLSFLTYLPFLASAEGKKKDILCLDSLSSSRAPTFCDWLPISHHVILLLTRTGSIFHDARKWLAMSERTADGIFEERGAGKGA
jgi:hypothetical protein